MSESPYRYLDRFRPLASGPPLPNPKRRYALDMAYNVIDMKSRQKIDDANRNLCLDNIEALEELCEEIQTYLALIRRPVRDGVVLTSDEAVELCEVSESARPLTIGLRHAQRATSTGPLDRHHELKRRQPCTTSTQGVSDPEYR